MKKIIYFLLIIILLAGIAGGGYMLYKHFNNTDEPKPEGNILTESQTLLNNHASITFGEGDSAWTISTADKLAPIYIDDLRAPGKGIKLADGLSSSGGGTGLLSNYGISVEGKNLLSVSISGGSRYDSIVFETTLDIDNNRYIVPRADSFFFENIFYSLHKKNDDVSNGGTRYEQLVLELEKKIAKECVAGDNYLLGVYSLAFTFCDIEMYPDYDIYAEPNSESVASGLLVNIPVYYRVK